MKTRIFLCLTLIAGSLIAGCAKPPQVSAENRKLIDGLRSATSTEQIAWVDECAKQLEDNKAHGAMTDAEYREFNAIIALAREGKWQEAEEATVRLGKAQRPTPDDLRRLKSPPGRR